MAKYLFFHWKMMTLIITQNFAERYPFQWNLIWEKALNPEWVQKASVDSLMVAAMHAGSSYRATTH